jgi:hypothetical protein
MDVLHIDDADITASIVAGLRAHREEFIANFTVHHGVHPRLGPLTLILDQAGAGALCWTARLTWHRRPRKASARNELRWRRRFPDGTELSN